MKILCEMFEDLFMLRYVCMYIRKVVCCTYEAMYVLYTVYSYEYSTTMHNARETESRESYVSLLDRLTAL